MTCWHENFSFLLWGADWKMVHIHVMNLSSSLPCAEWLGATSFLGWWKGALPHANKRLLYHICDGLHLQSSAMGWFWTNISSNRGQQAKLAICNCWCPSVVSGSDLSWTKCARSNTWVSLKAGDTPMFPLHTFRNDHTPRDSLCGTHFQVFSEGAKWWQKAHQRRVSLPNCSTPPRSGPVRMPIICYDDHSPS